MMLTGYPVEDLALRDSFVDASVATLEATARQLAADGLGGIAVVTGYLGRRAGGTPRVGEPVSSAQNAAALLHGGTVAVTTAKHHLPNYGVFDEYRYFVPGNRLPVVRPGPRASRPAAGTPVDVAIAICEDLWQDGGPVAVTRQAGAGLLVVPNASPYERGKDQARLELVARRAREAGAALAYVNMMSGQDELVFDGDSIIVDAEGGLIARGPQFEETLLVADLDLPPARPVPDTTPASGHSRRGQRRHRDDHPPGGAARRGPRQPGPLPPLAEPVISPRLAPRAEVYAALVTGVRDYVRKNGFRSVILGLSGGIDSALVATIAADALGPDQVHVVLMPSQYSSGHSVSDAEDLAKRQGLHARTVPIGRHGRRVPGRAEPGRDWPRRTSSPGSAA